MKHVIYWNKISYTKFRGLMIEKCDCQIYANFGFMYMSDLKVHTQEDRNDVWYLTNIIFVLLIYGVFLCFNIQVELISLMMTPL